VAVAEENGKVPERRPDGGSKISIGTKKKVSAGDLYHERAIAVKAGRKRLKIDGD